MRNRLPAFSLLISAALLLPAIPCHAGEAEAGADAQIRFGVDMAKRGLWQEALFRFQQAERLDPQNFRVWNNLAVAYEATGQFEEALEAYQRGLRIDSGRSDTPSPADTRARFVCMLPGWTTRGAKPARRQAAM